MCLQWLIHHLAVLMPIFPALLTRLSHRFSEMDEMFILQMETDAQWDKEMYSTQGHRKRERQPGLGFTLPQWTDYKGEGGWTEVLLLLSPPHTKFFKLQWKWSFIALAELNILQRGKKKKSLYNLVVSYWKINLCFFKDESNRAFVPEICQWHK